MPNLSGVNRRKRPPTKEEPQFLRRKAHAYDRGAPAKILGPGVGWQVVGQEEIQALEAQKDATEDRRGALESDPEAVERVAREEYGMIRDGEICYRIIEEDDE